MIISRQKYKGSHHRLRRHNRGPTALKVPRITLRLSNDRPETITIGTNELVGTDPKNLIPFLGKLKLGEWKKSGIPIYWDGNSDHRIVSKLLEIGST